MPGTAVRHRDVPPLMIDVDTIISDILRREGGYVYIPEDRGGPTNLGITMPTLSVYLSRAATLDELKSLDERQARKIYFELYVKAPGYSVIGNQRVLALLVDMAVNHGAPNATRMVQRACRVKDDGVFGPITAAACRALEGSHLYSKLLAERARFYGRLITKDPTQSKFAAGWMNRLAEFVEKTA